MGYTKGDWKACATPLGGHGLMINGKLVADINTDCPDDAHLIAAVPKLYEALEKAQQDINWMLNNNSFLNPECFEYIEKALSKAEGK